MSSVGKTVYKVSDVHRLSFGKVVNQDVCGGWTWYQIDWTNDAPTNMYQRPNYNSESGWFRCDSVVLFEVQTMVELLEDLQ